MNYKHYRLEYCNLIKKYQDNPPNAAKVYCEVHHIRPKSLGGTDKPSNLVLLPYEAHVLAHELLFKCYADFPSTSPARISMTKAYQAVCIPRKRSQYIASKKAIGAQKTYTFVSNSGTVFVGTANSFRAKCGLSQEAVWGLTVNKYHTRGGWRIEQKNGRADYSDSSSLDVYTLVNRRKKLKITGNRSYLMATAQLTVDQVRNLCLKRSTVTSCGWRLAK